MLAFVLRRIAQAVLVMLAVGLIAFSLFTFVGDPVASMLGQDATPEAHERITGCSGSTSPSTSNTQTFSRARCRGISA